MKELKINQVRHKVEATIGYDEIKKFFEQQTGVKIEGNIKSISTYGYSSSKELEITITSIKEDRLKELVFDVKKDE